MTPKEDIKKALDGLAQFIIMNDNGTDESASVIEWHSIIKQALTELEALKKRDTAMKPKMVDYTTQHYSCPSCNETISVDESKTFNKSFNVFCRCCGQRLDWSKEE